MFLHQIRNNGLVSQKQDLTFNCLEKALKDQTRKNNYEVITKNRYNIVEEAKKLQERYIELYRENI